MPDLFRGAARRLDDEDLPRIGAEIGVGEDELHTVLDVECRGSGFDRSGRVAMLFEPHIFWRELGSGPARSIAAREQLACQRWGQFKYPSDSYPRLLVAMEIDKDAALRSASWGLGQVMGFNHGLAGYRSAEEMVAAFAQDEENQLRGMVSFIAKTHLADALRKHDWAGFACGYNGAGYASHGYHTRLAARYAFWKGKPDTPWKRSA